MRIGTFILIAAVVLAGSPGCVRRETLGLVPSSLMAPPSSNTSEAAAVLSGGHATVSARVKFRSVGRWALVIDASAARAEAGPWPRLRVTIGGTSYGAITLDRQQPSRYWLNFPTEPGFSDVHVMLLNGVPGATGPTVTIAGLEIVPL